MTLGSNGSLFDPEDGLQRDAHSPVERQSGRCAQIGGQAGQPGAQMVMLKFL